MLAVILVCEPTDIVRHRWSCSLSLSLFLALSLVVSYSFSRCFSLLFSVYSCRESMKVVPLAQCGLPPAKRFTFYSQVCS